MFDASTGSIIRDFAESSGGGIYSRIAFSEDQQLFLRSYDSNSPPNRNQLIAYRIGTWEELWGLRIAPLNVISMAVSADGRFAALGGITLGPGVVHNAQILIVDLAGKRIVRTIDNAFPPENRVEQVAWNPDGIHLAAGGIVGGTFSGSDAVRVFDISSGEVVSRESASPADISFLRYTPNGKYLIEGGFKSSVRIWDGAHQNLIQELPNGHANALAVSRDSSYFAVSDGARVEVWKFR
jgi:WD40 repeat protein